MNKLSNHWISVAIALVGVLSAVLATPLLFPASAKAAAKDAFIKEANAKEKMPPADEQALTKLGIAILGITAAGIASLWIIKHTKTLSFRRLAFGRGGRRKRLEVIDVLNLGNKKSIAVARIYDRVVVLGIGDGPVSLITELTEEEAGLAPAEIAARDLELTNEGRRAAPPSFRGIINNFLQPSANRAVRDIEIPSAPRRTQPAPRRTIAELQEMENSRVNVTVGASVDEDLL